MIGVYAGCSASAYLFTLLSRPDLNSGGGFLTLALGIGANTAMFTLLNQALLRRLAVEKPEEIALVKTQGPFYGSTWGGGDAISGQPEEGRRQPDVQAARQLRRDEGPRG